MRGDERERHVCVCVSVCVCVVGLSLPLPLRVALTERAVLRFGKCHARTKVIVAVAPGSSVTAPTTPPTHDALAADAVEGTAALGATSFFATNCAKISASLAACVSTVTLADDTPVDGLTMALTARLPPFSFVDARLGLEREMPVACGVLTFPPHIASPAAVVQSAWPSQPTKFCCASITRTATLFVVEGLVSVKVKIAEGSEDSFTAVGISGVVASIATVAGNPTISYASSATG